MRFPFLELATVNAPYFTEIKERLERAVEAGRYIGGSEVEQFETNLANIAGTRFAIGVSNGLDALRLILLAYIEMGQLNPGDEVIVPANTYIASILAISHAGLTPVLAEPDESTSNLNTSRLEGLITPRTRAIMPVHLYGRVCFDQTLKELASRHNLLIIEDNAQAIGATSLTQGINGSYHTGGLGHAAAFSFYPTKNIGALGDAGAVTTSDPHLAATVRALANYGADHRYHNLYIGYNCRLDTLQATILNCKLPHTNEENTLRRAIASIYCSEIKNEAIRMPMPSSDCVFHQFVVHVDDRKHFTDFLDANGIGWDIHYATPAHLQPCYNRPANRQPSINPRKVYSDTPIGNPHFSRIEPGLILPKGGLPVTERLADTCVSLPISRCTTPSDARAIASILTSYRK